MKHYTRYADDAIVHCRSQAEAERLLAEIGERLAFCRLIMHPDKPPVPM
jgi:RNA-directed DNA polymerase